MTEPQSDPDAEQPPAQPASPDVGDYRHGQEDALEEWTGTTWAPYQHPARDSDEEYIYKSFEGH